MRRIVKYTLHYMTVMKNDIPTGQTVLVTGGGGFIGSHLIDVLVENNTVRVLDNFSSGRIENISTAAICIKGDIRDPATIAEAMAGVDLVFHEAALVSVAESVATPRRSHTINVGATVELLNHARAEDARVVFASSAAIYGPPESLPVSEDTVKKPTSPYGIDKLAADHYVRAYAELYDLPTVCLRYFNVYGPRQTAGDYSGVVSVFFDRARSGEPLIIDGDGTQTRDFVHISDVVRANLTAAVTDYTGEAFNIGTGAATTIQQLAENIIQITESDSEIVHGDSRPNDIRHSRADIERAKATLGYEPTMALSDGLTTLVETDHYQSYAN
jgi:UDP-glucose 4-epimerase